eukprot:gene16791-19948_t
MSANAGLSAPPPPSKLLPWLISSQDLRTVGEILREILTKLQNDAADPKSYVPYAAFENQLSEVLRNSSLNTRSLIEEVRAIGLLHVRGDYPSQEVGFSSPEAPRVIRQARRFAQRLETQPQPGDWTPSFCAAIQEHVPGKGLETKEVLYDYMPLATRRDLPSHSRVTRVQTFLNELEAGSSNAHQPPPNSANFTSESFGKKVKLSLPRSAETHYLLPRKVGDSLKYSLFNLHDQHGTGVGTTLFLSWLQTRGGPSRFQYSCPRLFFSAAEREGLLYRVPPSTPGEVKVVLNLSVVQRLATLVREVCVPETRGRQWGDTIGQRGDWQKHLSVAQGRTCVMLSVLPALYETRFGSKMNHLRV